MDVDQEGYSEGRHNDFTVQYSESSFFDFNRQKEQQKPIQDYYMDEFRTGQKSLMDKRNYSNMDDRMDTMHHIVNEKTNNNEMDRMETMFHSVNDKTNNNNDYTNNNNDYTNNNNDYTNNDYTNNDYTNGHDNDMDSMEFEDTESNVYSDHEDQDETFYTSEFPDHPIHHFNRRNEKDCSRCTGKLSSTSRELAEIEEIRKGLLKTKIQTEQYRRRIQEKGPQLNFSERSVKPLTIPRSPHLSHGINPKVKSQSDDNCSDFRFESFVSRDKSKENYATKPLQITEPHSPKLSTSLRAQTRKPPLISSRESSMKPSSSTKCGVVYRGKPQTISYVPKLTQAKSPMLQTQFRKRNPIEVVDADEQELQKQFHALELNRDILSKPKTKTKTLLPLTRPQSPMLATSLRARFYPSPSSNETTPEKKPFKARSVPKASSPFKPRYGENELVVPETPKLQSLVLHNQYKARFSEKLLEEERMQEEKRQFHARPMPLSKPHSLQRSTKDLTEVQPFHMPGDWHYRHAMIKLEQDKLEAEKLARESARVKALPLPNMQKAFIPHKSKKPLTEINGPKMASDIQARRRNLFEMEKQRRKEQEDACKMQMAIELKKKEDMELKELRNKLSFQSTGVLVGAPLLVRPSEKKLTIPQSPHLSTKYVSKKREIQAQHHMCA